MLVGRNIDDLCDIFSRIAFMTAYDNVRRLLQSPVAGVCHWSFFFFPVLYVQHLKCTVRALVTAHYVRYDVVRDNSTTTRSSADADNRRDAFSRLEVNKPDPFWVRCDFSLSM